MEHPTPSGDQPANTKKTSFLRSLRHVSRGWRRIAALAFGVTAVIAGIAAFYYLILHPRQTIVTLPFRVAFEANEEGQIFYPNGLPFSPSDIVGSRIVETAFRGQGLAQYCQFDEFRRGLVVQVGATERQLLDATFEPLLSNVRLTPIERLQLEEQYRARIAGLPIEYQLTYVASESCRGIPSQVQKAVLSAILEEWAKESEARRGVLRYQVAMVRPSIFDETNLGQARIVRLDLIRRSIQRAIQVLDQVAELPGAQSVRPGDSTMTLPEIRGRLADLRISVIEPLIAMESAAGASRWLQEARTTARLQKEAAQIRAEAYRTALREFSGSPQALSVGTTEARPRLNTPTGTPGSQEQATIPQLDSSFIDRIVQLSTQTSEFREDLTRKMVEAEVDGISFRSDEAYYAQILERGGVERPSVDGPPVDARIDAAIKEGRRLVAAMNALYDELNTVGLRPGAALYSVTGGVSSRTSWPIAEFLQVIAMSLLVSLLVIAAAALIEQHLKAQRRVSRRP